MPHYWFDLADNGHLISDPDGLPLVSLKEARTEALKTLAEMARDETPIMDAGGGEWELTITVRDSGSAICRVALVMRCEPARAAR